MNLEKYTKAELISKLQKLEKENSIKSDSNNKKEVILTSNSKTKSDSSFWSILTKIKLWILSWALITFLIRLFRNYKHLRNILRIMNYVILSLFGVSMFQTFGSSIFGPLKLWIMHVLEHTIDIQEQFSQFLARIFNQTDTIPSTRVIYKKPLDNDWKAELEKADREREYKKWLEKHSQLKESEESHYKMIILCILTFGAAVAIWYYGKDALDLIYNEFIWYYRLYNQCLFILLLIIYPI